MLKYYEEEFNPLVVSSASAIICSYLEVPSWRSKRSKRPRFTETIMFPR